jgi:hypothetical protein
MHTRSISSCLGILIFIFAMLFSAPVLAESMTISGPSRFFVSDCATDKIVLRLRSEATIDAVRTVEVADSHGNKSDWTINWDKPVLSDASIHEYQSSATLQQRCPASGSFIIVLSVYASGASNGLTIYVDRLVDPKLQVPATVTLAVNEHPWDLTRFGWQSNTEGMAVDVHEASNVTSLHDLSASPGQLVDSSGKPMSSELRPDKLKLDIVAGGIEPLKFGLTSRLSPGPYTTRISLSSPALKQGQDVNVTVMVKVFSGYLLGTILLGILLGVLVNNFLLQRSALDVAKLDALRAGDDIARKASAQHDPAVQQRLISLAAQAHDNIYAAGTLAQVQAALEAAQTSASEAEKNAIATAQLFSERLTALHDKLNPNGLRPDADIAKCLEPVNTAVSRIELLGGNGQVEDAVDKLQDFTENEFQSAVEQAVQPWLSVTLTSFTKLGAWASPAEDAQSAFEAIKPKFIEAASLSEPASLVQKADEIAHALRSAVTLSVPGAMAAAFNAAASILQGASPALAEELTRYASNVSQPRAGEVSLSMTLDALAAVRQQVASRLQGVSTANSEVRACLDRGDFPGAAHLLLTVVAAAPAANALAAPAMVLMPSFGAGAVFNPAASVVPILRIIGPPRLEVMSKARMTLYGFDSPFPGTVKWRCDPIDAGKIAQDDWRGAQLTPSRPGFLTILVSVPQMNVETSVRAMVGNVAQHRDFKALEKRSLLWRIVIAVVIACLTAFAGFQIFAPTWYGTPGDFFSAFVWGFFGQFGLDRVRDLSKPLLGKTL